MKIDLKKYSWDEIINEYENQKDYVELLWSNNLKSNIKQCYTQCGTEKSIKDRMTSYQIDDMINSTRGKGMIKVYGLLVVVGLLAGVGYGAYYYYNDTQERLATLRDSNAKLEVANKQNQATIQAMKDNYKKQQELNNELTAKLVKAEQYGNALRKKLSKIDLPKDSLLKAAETEERINNASQKVLDMFESITTR